MPSDSPTTKKERYCPMPDDVCGDCGYRCDTPWQYRPIPVTADIARAWRLSAADAIATGAVRLGQFNWPQAILALLDEREISNGR